MLLDCIVFLMMGGGVCVVYQVGVLCGIVGLVQEYVFGVVCMLFDVICGILVGVINSFGFVCGVQDFMFVIEVFIQFWGSLYVDCVYCMDVGCVGFSGVWWLIVLVFGWMIGCMLCVLFDNMLLCELFEL